MPGIRKIVAALAGTVLVGIGVCTPASAVTEESTVTPQRCVISFAIPENEPKHLETAVRHAAAVWEGALDGAVSFDVHRASGDARFDRRTPYLSAPDGSTLTVRSMPAGAYNAAAKSVGVTTRSEPSPGLTAGASSFRSPVLVGQTRAGSPEGVATVSSLH